MGTLRLMDPETAATASAVAAIAAAVGAAISAGVAAVAVYVQWRSNQPRVKVVGQTAIFINDQGTSPTLVSIEVRNGGSLPITVTGVGYRLADGGRLAVLMPMNDQLQTLGVLPRVVGIGEAASFYQDIYHAADAHRENKHHGGIASVWARTAAGGEYRGTMKAQLDTFKRPE